MISPILIAFFAAGTSGATGFTAGTSGAARFTAGAPRRVVVFNSTSWGGPKAEESAACEAYAAGVAAFLRASGMDVSHAPEGMSEYETLEALLGASAVVAGMPSSFSFLPGVAKAARGAPYLGLQLVGVGDAHVLLPSRPVTAPAEHLHL